MMISFKRSCTCTAAFSALDPPAGHHQPTPLPETPGLLQASPGKSLVGSLFLSPGFLCTLSFICALQESVSLVLCKFCNQILYPPEMLSGFKQNLVYTGLRHLTETGPDLPLSVVSVSCGDTGQQWPVTGAEALGEANLGHTACGISCFGGGHR